MKCRWRFERQISRSNVMLLHMLSYAAVGAIDARVWIQQIQNNDMPACVHASHLVAYSSSDWRTFTARDICLHCRGAPTERHTTRSTRGWAAGQSVRAGGSGSMRPPGSGPHRRPSSRWRSTSAYCDTGLGGPVTCCCYLDAYSHGDLPTYVSTWHQSLLVYGDIMDDWARNCSCHRPNPNVPMHVKRFQTAEWRTQANAIVKLLSCQRIDVAIHAWRAYMTWTMLRLSHLLYNLLSLVLKLQTYNRGEYRDELRAHTRNAYKCKFLKRA